MSVKWNGPIDGIDETTAIGGCPLCPVPGLASLGAYNFQSVGADAKSSPGVPSLGGSDKERE